jgi:carbonic anhydrase
MADEILHRLQRFRTQYFQHFEDEFKHLVERGQKPRALFIGCSDSRVLPNLLTGMGPGDLFVVRNVGALVPPYQSDQHAAAAAVEYAVLVLGVRHIVVCGHTHCGAMRALYRDPKPGADHLAQWLELAREPRCL